MTWIKAVFKGVGGFLLPFVKMFVSASGPVLAAAAHSAVRAVEESAISGGDAKRKEAFRRIENDLKRQGIAIGADVTASMINAAIEAAVQKIAHGR